MKRVFVALGLFLAAVVATDLLTAESGGGAGSGQGATDREFPPCVVSTFPANRAKSVDYNLKEIKATFDRPMKTGKAYSWMIYNDLGEWPGYANSPAPYWERDGKTCVVHVKLKPDTVYAIGVNNSQYNNFRDAEGRMAVPYVWVFKTKKGE